MTPEPELESARFHLALSWDEIQRDAARLAEMLKPRNTWHGVVAVARGGLVPAALVARALGLRAVETVSIATYQGESLGQPYLLKPPTAAGDGTGWLVVDDLVDTGATMHIVRTIMPRAFVAVLYAKPAGRPLADCFVREFPQDSWLDFPWEMDGAL
jgi:xanthine phosphoribosyltransferase